MKNIDHFPLSGKQSHRREKQLRKTLLPHVRFHSQHFVSPFHIPLKSSVVEIQTHISLNLNIRIIFLFFLRCISTETCCTVSRILKRKKKLRDGATSQLFSKSFLHKSHSFSTGIVSVPILVVTFYSDLRMAINSESFRGESRVLFSSFVFSPRRKFVFFFSVVQLFIITHLSFYVRE